MSAPSGAVSAPASLPAAPDVTPATWRAARPFDGLTALITGASGDIGTAIALALGDLGAVVRVVGRRAPVLEALAASAGPGSPSIVVHPADLSLDHEVARLADRVGPECGRLDVLVHCAGLIALGPHESAPIEDFDRQYRTNV